jgi:hypothetical protein
VNRYDEKNPISCEAIVAFIEGKVSVRNIPEEIITDISVNIKTSEDGFAQASRYVKADEPFHFIVDPGEYILECRLDQVKLQCKPFRVNPSERRVVNFLFVNEN